MRSTATSTRSVCQTWKLFVLSLCFLPATAASREVAYVASSIADVVTVVDLGNFEKLATLPVVSDTLDIAASPDGRTVVVGGDEGVTVIDTASNQVVSTIPVPFRVRGLAFAPAADRVYGAVDARAYLEIDLAAESVSVVDFGSDTLDIVVSGGGDTLYIVHEPGPSSAAGISIVDQPTGAVHADTTFGVFTPGLPALPPPGELLYVPVGGRLGLVEVDAAQGSQVGLLELGGPQNCAVSDSSGRLLYVSNSGGIAIVERSTGEIVRGLGVETPPCGFAVDAAGRVLAVSQQFSALLVLNPDDFSVDTPVIAAVPVPPQPESVAVADVPPAVSDGGCAAGGWRRGGSPVAGLLLLLALCRAQASAARARRSTASGWARPPTSTTISAQRR